MATAPLEKMTLATVGKLEQQKVTSKIDEKTGAKIIVMVPRKFCIAWGNDRRYWEWIPLFREKHLLPYCDSLESLIDVETAKLIQVCWLEIEGMFDMSLLTPSTLYEVSFIVMLKKPEGFESPVTLKLQLPNESMSQEVVLNQLPHDQWTKLVIGDFKSSRAGVVKFSMLETTRLNWKKGLFLLCAIIIPKKCPSTTDDDL